MGGVLLLTLMGAAPEGQAGCFDWNDAKALTSPLKEPLTPGQEQFGQRPAGGGWGAVAALVPVPVARVLQDLRRHDSTKTSDIAEFKIRPLPAQGLLERHEAAFTVKPFLFITVEWVERWGFALVQGTPAAPQKVVASYEKVEGTSHIKHLCGSIVIQARDAAHTEIFLFEEADASRRSPEDTLKGLKDTVRALVNLTRPS